MNHLEKVCQCVVKGAWPIPTRYDIAMVTKSPALTRPIVSTVGHYTHAELTSEKSDRLRGEQIAPSRDFRIKSIDGLKLTVKTETKKKKRKTENESEIRSYHHKHGLDPLDRHTPTEFRYHSDHHNHHGHSDHRVHPDHRDHRSHADHRTHSDHHLLSDHRTHSDHSEFTSADEEKGYHEDTTKKNQKIVDGISGIDVFHQHPNSEHQSLPRNVQVKRN